MKDELRWKAELLILFLHEIIARINKIIVLWTCLTANRCEAAAFNDSDLNHFSGSSLGRPEHEQ